MSTTEGFWSGKLFQIKLDVEEIISRGERKFEIGWEWGNKKRKFGNDKTEENEGEKNRGNNNNDKKSRFRRDVKFGEEKRDLRKDFGVGETFGTEAEGERKMKTISTSSIVRIIIIMVKARIN